MAITYLGFGAASAVTTASTPAYPAGLSAGDLLVLYIISDSASIPTGQTGWTQIGSLTTGGGLTGGAWAKTSTGSETGTFTTTGTITGGTKGVSWIKAFHASVGTMSASPAHAADTDTTTTSFSATSVATPATVVGDVVEAAWVSLAPTGSYTASASATSVAQSGVTATPTARFGGRTGTNTLTYSSLDGTASAVTAAGTVTVTGTCVGANAAGVALAAVIHETSAASSPQAITAVTGGTQYGAAATLVAGMNDADDTTGATGASLDLTFGGTLSTGSPDAPGVTFRARSDTGATVTKAGRLYAADGTTPVGASQDFALTTTLQDFTYVLTGGEAAALTNRAGLIFRLT